MCYVTGSLLLCVEQPTSVTLRGQSRSKRRSKREINLDGGSRGRLFSSHKVEFDVNEKSSENFHPASKLVIFVVGCLIHHVKKVTANDKGNFPIFFLPSLSPPEL